MKTIEEIRRANARDLAKDAGGNSAFAEHIDRSPTQVSRFMGKGATREIGSKLARHIEYCFSKDEGWLDKEHYSEKCSSTTNALKSKTLEIPILSWVQAGAFCNSESQVIPQDCDTILCPNKSASKSTFALRVVGDSMTSPYGRTYPEGTIIYVDPEQEPASGKRVVARTEQGHTFKELAINEFGEYYLKALNPHHQPIFDKGIEVCGIVIGSYIGE
ncbi:LexA family protein [Aliivibrio logei]|uniref:LexA family protein n=1 Tax=Aliivibrio logei TaxID=688 RepID=UPI00047DDCAE|nr:S24 family peptidase [Aliivibrio logei]